MATLTNTQISVTYVGLLKTSANTVLTSTAQQITDGSGNNSILYLSTAGVGIGGSPASGKELDVTGNVQVTGDLIVDNITIDGSTITNASGDLTIVNTVNDGDVIFQSDNSSGGTTEYFRLDGGLVLNEFSQHTRAIDNKFLGVGNSTDLYMFHDGSNSHIKNGTGSLTIEQQVDDGDIIFKCDDGSGSTTTYYKIDGSAEKNEFFKSLFLFDNVKLQIGNSGDLEIYHDGSNSFISDQGTGTLKILSNGVEIKNAGDSGFMAFFGATGASELYFNTSKKFETTSAGVEISGSLTIDGDGNSNAEITSSTASSIVTLNVGGFTGTPSLARDVKVFVNSASGSRTEALHIDSSQNATFAGNISLADSRNINLGDGGDLQIVHNGTNSFIENNTGDLTLQNNADDKDIIFKSDDGSGSTTEYFKLDGNNVNVRVSQNFSFNDSVKAAFGNSGDLQIYHDGSHSRIDDVGTGKLILRGNTDVEIHKYTGEYMLTATADGAVALYFDDSKKFETTSTGANITDDEFNLGDGAYQQVLFDTSPSSVIGTGTMEIQPTTVPGSGTANFTTYFKSKVASGTTNHNIKVDGTATFGGNISVPASSKILLDGASGHTYIEEESDSNLKFYVAGSERLNITNSSASFTGDVSLADSKKVSLGASDDFNMSHNGTDTTIQNITGHLNIINKSNDKDIFIENDDGSGGTTTYLMADGSEGALKLFHYGSKKFETTSAGISVTGEALIEGRLQVTSSAPEVLFSVPSGGLDSRIHNDGSGNFIFGTGANSTTPTERMRITSAGLVGINETSPDASLHIKSSDNLLAILESTDSLAYMSFVDSSTTSNTSVAIGADANNLAFYTGTSFGTEKMRLTSSGLLGIGTTSPSNGKLQIDSSTNQISIETGTSGDGRLHIGHFSNGTFIGTYGDDGGAADLLRFGVHSGDVALTINSDLSATFAGNITMNASTLTISGTYPRINLTDTNNNDDFSIINNDGSFAIFNVTDSLFSLLIDTSNNATFAGNINLADSKNLNIGTGNDLFFVHNGTNSFIQNANGDFYIEQASNDKDIIFRNDDGSGGLAEYMKLDGSDNVLRIHKRTIVDDNVKIDFGGGQDLQIYHDGSNSYVEQAGTGDLIIRNSADDKDILLQTDNGSGLVTSYIQLDGSDLSTKILTQKVILSNLPTSDPNNAGQLYNESGFLRVSAG